MASEPVGKDPFENEPDPANPEPDIERLNLANAEPRRRNMLGTEISVRWDSYMAQGTKLCSQLVSRLATEVGVAKHPDRFRAGIIKGHPGDISLEPTITPDESTVEARWSDTGLIHFYFERLLGVRPLLIPQGMRAHIEVSRYESKSGPVLRVHLSKPRFAEIGKKVRKKKSDGQGQGSAAGEASENKEQPDQGKAE